MKLLKTIKLAVYVGIVLILAACGGGGSEGSSGSGGNGSSTLFSLGGTLSGLNTGNQVTFQVVLSNGTNGSDSTNSATITTNGTFATPAFVPMNGSYVLIVVTQPAGQICTVENSAGNNVTANVTNIGVVCSSTFFTVSGTVSGLLQGQQVALQNNNADNLTVGANGTFTFATPVAQNSVYDVTVLTPPVMSACTVSHPNGANVTAAITNVSIDCNVSESVLYSFTGRPNADAYNPQVALVQGANGDFYGTSGNGGANGTYGFGTVFGITPTGSEDFLYSFKGSTLDGACPQAPLILSTDGNFYGTTCSGGQYGIGTVFKITPGGAETVLYSFGTTSGDGINPYSALIQGSDGNFYGTTGAGGANSKGTIFKVTPAGVETLLYSFGANSTDANGPHAALIQASDGNLYGTTMKGGQYNLGTVFKITLSGTATESVIWSFGSGNDGRMALSNVTQVAASLIQASDGIMYGTTPAGGVNGKGTVYSITTLGVEVPLYSFASGTGDGQQPTAALLLANDGNFYGTTVDGGTYGAGTVYKITADGTETLMYSFGAPGDGQNPYAPLIQATDGHLYGTTYLGGTVNSGVYGTVFKF